MAAQDVIRAIVWQGTDATMLARITVAGQNAGQVGVPAVQTVTRKIYDLDSATPTTAINTAALTPGSVVLGALYTTWGWDEDATGYNFRDTIAGSVFSAGRRYRAEYVYTAANGEKGRVVFELAAREVYSV